MFRNTNMRLIACLLARLVSGNDVHEDEEFIVYPGGEEHSFSKTMVESTFDF